MFYLCYLYYLRILIFVSVFLITFASLSLSVGPFYCLSFFDCRLLNTNLVSSNFSSLHLYIATKITNHKHVMRDLSIHDFKLKHPDCTSSIYNQACHVIFGDLNILRNTFVTKSVEVSWDQILFSPRVYVHFCGFSRSDYAGQNIFLTENYSS